MLDLLQVRLNVPMIGLGIQFSDYAAGRPKVDLNTVVLVAIEELRRAIVPRRNVSHASPG